MLEHQTMYSRFEHWIQGLMKAYFTQKDLGGVCVYVCLKAGSVIHKLYNPLEMMSVSS